MRPKGREQGRFVALSGFRKLAGSPGGRYEVLIVDGNGRPVSHLCEWHRLRKRPGSNGTRRTYLNFLHPFFAYLNARGYAWNAPPEQIRSYVRVFLLEDLSCEVSRDTALDGYRVTLTGSSPLSASSLRVLLAAICDFYAVMAEAGLYAYDNPMRSELLQRWKRERIKAIANSGAPDHAGTRSERWHETNKQPTAFFRQRRGEPWKPDVALTSEQIQLRMNTDLDWMARHASTQRDRLVLMILRETGARLSEVFSMTAGGFRKAKDPYQASITNKGSYGREDKRIRLAPPVEAALVRYVRTERAKLDPQARKRLSQLDDTDPIFLTQRRTPYNRDAFYHNWHKLYAARLPQKDERSGATLPHLEFTAHDLRHLRVTIWLTAIRKVKGADCAQMLRRCVQRRMAWRDPLTLLCYDHSFTEREEGEIFADVQHETERQAEVSAAVVPMTIKVQLQEASSVPQHSAAMLQVLGDLEFWKDEP
jgi:Site-specific recombinase XerD